MKDEDLYLRLGRLLRTRRRLLGLTQAQVAQRCGTTFQQIQKYECGLASVSVGRLIGIAAGLQTSAGGLLEAALAPSLGTHPSPAPPSTPRPAGQPEPDRSPDAHPAA